MNIGTLERLSKKLNERNELIIHERGDKGDTELTFTTRIILLLIADIIDEVVMEELERLDKTRFMNE